LFRVRRRASRPLGASAASDRQQYESEC
jgi:hypothetical protein